MSDTAEVTRGLMTAPVVDATPRAGGVEQGIALCLSGGGYRAMLFHLGGLWRLNEAGLLKPLKRVSSVSGGSITAGVLGMNWLNLGFDQDGVAANLGDQVIRPVRELARHTIDVGSVFGGALNPFSTIADTIARAYRTHLFGDATLQRLPDDSQGPRFVLNATNVQTGKLWRFSRPFMGDYQVGQVPRPNTPLAMAVTASSAFPPVLSPVHLKLKAGQVQPVEGATLHQPPYTTNVVLTDGGVYDNLGLETAFKRYDTLLVSDGGALLAPDPDPHSDWARHGLRIVEVIDAQVRSLRKRLLIAAYEDGQAGRPAGRKGTYWGIATDIADYHLSDALPCPPDRVHELATQPTRLASVDEDIQERLINWGYAVCDAALRKFYPPPRTTPPAFPYPARGV